MQRQAKIPQGFLFGLAKVSLGVTCKRGLVQRPIRRVEVDEVTRGGIQFAEVPQPDIDALQRRMTSAEQLCLANCGILVVSNRYIEFAFGIDAPKAVVAGLVEIDETRRNLDAVVELVLASNLVEIVFAVLAGVLLKPGDEGLGIALDNLVGVDEIEIDIT